MRKTLMLFCVALFSLTLAAQEASKGYTDVPIGKLWKFESGESHEDVLDKVKAQYKTGKMKIDGSNIYIKDIAFAGYAFDLVSLSIDDVYGLYGVEFFKCGEFSVDDDSIVRGSVVNVANNLMFELIQKYGGDFKLEMGGSCVESIWINFEEGKGVSHKLILGEMVETFPMNSLFINYTDYSLAEKILESRQNEL